MTRSMNHVRKVPLLARSGLKNTSHPSFFVCLLGGLFFVRERRETLYVAYAYFRWLDDLIDETPLESSEARALIEREIRLVKLAYEDQFIETENYYEEALFRIIHCGQNPELLYEMIFSFLEALTWDIERRGHTPTRSELDHYSALLGEAYAQGLLYGFGLDPRVSEYKDLGREAGTAAHLAHMVRDSEEDRALGYINFTHEDMLHFDIIIEDPLCCGVKKWKKSLAHRACAIFEKTRGQGHILPTWRARAGFCLVCAKYHRLAKNIAGAA